MIKMQEAGASESNKFIKLASSLILFLIRIYLNEDIKIIKIKTIINHFHEFFMKSTNLKSPTKQTWKRSYFFNCSNFKIVRLAV